MGRGLQVPGATLLSCRGGEHLSGFALGSLTELGLCIEPVRISPQFNYDDVKVDGFGPYVPIDTQWQLASVQIDCKLIHFDPDTLDAIVAESMAGGTMPGGLALANAGFRLAPTGTLLGGRKPMYASGNHFFSLTIESDDIITGSGLPIRYRRCHLYQRPVVTPIGTKVQQVDLSFRALPYANPYRSGLYSGVNYGLNPVAAGLAIEVDGVLFVKSRESLASGAVIWDYVADD